MRQTIAGARWAWMAAAVVGLGALLVRPQAGATTPHGQAMTTPKTIGTLIKADPRFDALVAPGTPIEVLADGYDWSEGPVWVKRDGGFLLWSDVPVNTIFKWSPGEAAGPFMKPSGYTGVGKYSRRARHQRPDPRPQGRLIVCQHGDRRVSRYDWTGGKRTLADNYQGKRFNSPNDVVVKSNGDLYFTDPPYGLPERENDKTREGARLQRRLPLVGEDGKVTLLTKEMTFPNGIAFSPDEKTLYVANSDPEKAIWMAFPVKADGTIGAGRVFFDVTELVGDKKGLPDGMKVDARQPVRDRPRRRPRLRAGRHATSARIDTGEATANCGWGDDGATLYITADMYIVRLKTRTKGAGL